MRLEEYRTEIEAARLSLEMLARREADVKAVFQKSMQNLCRLAKEEAEPEALTGAVILMRAWLEMGFPYGMYRDLFDSVLKRAGLERNDVVSDEVREMRKIRLTRPQIRSMLGRWSTSSRNSMTKEKVVDDILDKVQQEVPGVYYYENFHSGPGRIQDIYELVVEEGGSFFHDIRRGRCYQLEEKGPKERKIEKN